jgi:hypothetical protein
VVGREAKEARSRSQGDRRSKLAFVIRALGLTGTTALRARWK